jgi:hypothetical protein
MDGLMAVVPAYRPEYEGVAIVEIDWPPPLQPDAQQEK